MGYKIKPSLSWINAYTIGIVPPSGRSAYLSIGDREFEITSTLEASTGRDGIGGMLNGVVSANTAYYVYAILIDQFPVLGISLNPPTEGPGFGTWTYIGAIATREGSATICQFQSAGGVTLFDDDIETETHSGDTTWTSYIYGSLPVTAKMACVKLFTDGAGGVEDIVAVNGTGTTNNYPVICYSQVLNVTNYNQGWVPIVTPQTMYLYTSDAAATASVYMTGWQEAPWEYP